MVEEGQVRRFALGFWAVIRRGRDGMMLGDGSRVGRSATWGSRDGRQPVRPDTSVAPAERPTSRPAARRREAGLTARADSPRLGTPAHVNRHRVAARCTARAGASWRGGTGRVLHEHHHHDASAEAYINDEWCGGAVVGGGLGVGVVRRCHGFVLVGVLGLVCKSGDSPLRCSMQNSEACGRFWCRTRSEQVQACLTLGGYSFMVA